MHNNMKHNNICIIGTPEGEEEEQGIENLFQEVMMGENQDGGVGRHTVLPRTTRTDRKSNGKEVRHQVDKKETFIQTGKRVRDGQPGQRGLELLCRDPDWQSVGRTEQAVQPLADTAALHSHTDKPRGPDSEWQRKGQAERWVQPHIHA